MSVRHTAVFLLFLDMIRFVHSYEGITAAECPFLCDCQGYDVTCVGSDVFPDGISEKVRKFQLINSAIDHIPINAFKGFPDLQEIRISGTTVRTVRACSFAQLENMTSLFFENFTVDVIEGNAFSNLNNVTKIEFKSSKIGEFKSYSFHNVSNVDRIVFNSTNISTIQTFAFLKLGKIGDIKIDNCVVDKLLVDGIARINETASFVVKNTRMKQWDCGTLSILEENGLHFEISNVSFQCDCKLSWLFEGFANSSIFEEESGNKCLGTGKLLAKTSLDEVCATPSSREKTCHKLLPSTPHTCRKSFDQPFNPEEKVEYPSYFTKQPRAAASGLLKDTKLHFLTLTLMSISLCICSVL